MTTSNDLPDDVVDNIFKHLDFEEEKKCFMRPGKGELVKLDLLDGLKTLRIQFIDKEEEDVVFFCPATDSSKRYEGEMDTFDISHLTQLESFSTAYFSRGTSRPKWILPKSLFNLRVTWPTMISGDLSTMCPRLNYFSIVPINVRDRAPLDPSQYPPSLRLLYTEAAFYSCDDKSVTEKNPPADRERFKLPSGHARLSLRGKENNTSPVVLDFESSAMLNLRSLVISSVLNLVIIGDLPTSLTSLTLLKTKFDFEKLKYLPNLTELIVEFMPFTDSDDELTSFAYDLPESLKKLTLMCYNLSEVHIKCPNLFYLSLTSNVFKVLNKSNFIIPDSVTELDFGSNDITDIQVDFPAGLQSLSIGNTKIKSLCNLPEGLKILRLEDIGIGKYPGDFVFPVGLGYLGLSSNEITNDWLKQLNILDCTNLKLLSLEENTLNGLDPDLLPTSLTNLSISWCGITSFSGNFAKFDKLEILTMCDNKLTGFFEKQEGRNNHSLEMVFECSMSWDAS
ncbi:E3 ubiquitin-protein ligase SlrP [Candida viswanathii]|uniref:E3 ubiquitin-protein ligase SlrP n=1 Tax=Candida viswanathii TaxID=5486 RepID=A0A367XWW7_9ASCO|nr:E3 ubiquitin-protein ligase SlrP [Candida viswanathii]